MKKVTGYTASRGSAVGSKSTIEDDYEVALKHLTHDY